MSAPHIEFIGVSKRFGGVVAVDEVSLAVDAGEFLTLVGPSGCGKTTLLRMLSGFERPDTGAVRLAGQDVTFLPPYRRNLNQVFQSYALFPHLSVRDNVGFGLRMQGLAGAARDERVEEVLALVALQGMEDRRPHQLSGGQRQRVALARALAPRPAVLLLDEPLSALDAKFRLQMQAELKRLQRHLRMTFVFVTHDRAEALAMGDRIAVMNRARLEQVAPPAEVYRRPATAFVADFIAEANLLPVALGAADAQGVRIRLEGSPDLVLPAGSWPDASASALAAFRPEKLRIARESSAGPGFYCRVTAVIFQGAAERLLLETEGGARLVALVSGRDSPAAGFRDGERVWCGLGAEDAVILPGSDKKLAARD